MMRRVAVGLAVLLAGLAVAGVVHQLRGPERIEFGGSVEPAVMAAAYHRGALPCLRYPTSADEPEAVLQGAASRLDEAGVDADTLSQVAGHFLRVHREREASLHARGSVDEHLEQFIAQQTGVVAKAWLWLQRDRLRATLARGLGDSSGVLADVEAQGEARWRALPEASRRALLALDDEAPTLFEGARLARVLDAVRPLTTRRRARALVARAEAAAAAHPGEPVRLADLHLEESEREDAWGRDFALSTVGASLVVRSLGSDERREGDDIVEPLLAAPATEAAPCGALGSSASIHRGELTDEVTHGTHVVPAFQAGRVIGFKLLGVRKDSLAARVGLCSGDVLRTVNGLALSEPEQAFDAASRLQRAKQVVLTLERGGVEGTLTVEVRD